MLYLDKIIQYVGNSVSDSRITKNWWDKMISLLILLLERVSFIILIAYIMLNIPAFKNLVFNRKNWKITSGLIIIFSLFAIVSNFFGVEINEGQIVLNEILTEIPESSSLANTRVLTIGISGIIGGPLVGISVGFLSSLVRYTQGGVDPYIYIISSLLIGMISGIYGKKFINKNIFPKPVQGALLGTSVEIIQMLCIVLFSRDLTASLELVKIISVPMIVMNSLGMAIFLSILNLSQQREIEARAIQTQDVLKLTNATLPYFRSGLNEISAEKAAMIIRKFMKVSAVSITNTQRILAHIGTGDDHHKPSFEILTDLSKEVIRSGDIKEAHSHEEIGCNHQNCSLNAAIVIPLKAKSKVLGTLKLYFENKEELTFVERKMAEGLGSIFSTQIELGEVELQSRLLQDAEIKSLQAQVNPHFFFNTINTISALIRIDSEQARFLLLKLSHFFRSNLQGARMNLITIEKELEQVKDYITLEKARFPNCFEVNIELEEELKRQLISPFLLQILIENAIKHAFDFKNQGNNIDIIVTKKDDIKIEVRDNGQGIPKELLRKLGKETIESKQGTGSALENLNRRLISLFNDNAALKFETSEKGTIVSCILPSSLKGVNE